MDEEAYRALVAAAASAVAAAGRGWHTANRTATTDADLDDCEERIGILLPPPYREFLKRRNGVEHGIDRRRFVRYYLTLLGTDEIVERTLEHRARAKTAFPEESFDGLVVFADTMDGDVCLFDKMQEGDGRVPVLWGGHEADPDEWRDTIVAADFDQWYRNVLTYIVEHGDHDDFRYWWEPAWTLRP